MLSLMLVGLSLNRKSVWIYTNGKRKMQENMRILMKRFHWTKFGIISVIRLTLWNMDFYPFIYYEKKFNKFTRKDGIKEKSRHLCYSAHIDRYIYSYYGYLLNQDDFFPSYHYVVEQKVGSFYDGSHIFLNGFK